MMWIRGTNNNMRAWCNLGTKQTYIMYKWCNVGTGEFAWFVQSGDHLLNVFVIVSKLGCKTIRTMKYNIIKKKYFHRNGN